MKSQTLLTFFITCFLFSCGEPHPTGEKSPELPKALNSSDEAYGSSSGQRYQDLVESLYSESIENSPELTALESDIRDLRTSRSDSLEAYDNFNNKNLSYYGDAKKHIEQISDSSLKEKIRIVLSVSLEKYQAKTLKHENILKSIEAKNLTLNDLHTLLKIMRTLPIMEKYQQEGLPATNSLQGFEKRLDKTIKTADSLVDQ